MSAHTVDWGDVPTWVSALTTLGALIAAGWVVAIELRRDDRARRARESGEQADLVAVWQRPSEPVIVLRNGSNLPIYAVRITLIHPTGERLRLPGMRTVPPGDHQLGYPGSFLADNLNTVEEWQCWVVFVDAASRVWSREIDGNLMRLDTVTGRELARSIEVEESRADAAASEGVDESPA